MKGNVTIEASYIFPFSFFVIGLVCYLGIFLYNESVLRLAAYECILQTICEDTKGILEEKLEKAAIECGNSRALAIEHLQVQVKSTVSKITVRYTATQSVLKIPIQVTAVYEKTFPESALRLTKIK